MPHGLGWEGWQGSLVSRGLVISGSPMCGAECSKAWDLSPSCDGQPWSAPASRMSGLPGRSLLAFQISRQSLSQEAGGLG